MGVCDSSAHLHDNSFPEFSVLVAESRLKHIKAYRSNLTYDMPLGTKERVFEPAKRCRAIMPGRCQSIRIFDDFVPEIII